MIFSLDFACAPQMWEYVYEMPMRWFACLKYHLAVS